MEFKQKGIERAKEYVKEVNSIELINYILPNCDATVGDVCFDDYTSGYNQAIQDSKAKEMLEMLQYLHSCMENYDGWREEYNKIDELIKQATEL